MGVKDEAAADQAAPSGAPEIKAYNEADQDSKIEEAEGEQPGKQADNAGLSNAQLREKTSLTPHLQNRVSTSGQALELTDIEGGLHERFLSSWARALIE